jgi:RinA family phage transcriptional activator
VLRLKREYFKFVERELFDYDSTLKNIREFENDLITSSGNSDLNSSIRSGVSKTTENKALKLINNKTLLRMTKTINDINKGIGKLDEELQELYKLRYRKQIHYNKIITHHLPMSQATYFRKRNIIVNIVANEMGLI